MGAVVNLFRLLTAPDISSFRTRFCMAMQHRDAPGCLAMRQKTCISNRESRLRIEARQVEHAFVYNVAHFPPGNQKLDHIAPCVPWLRSHSLLASYV